MYHGNSLCDEYSISGANKKHTPCGYNVIDIYSKLNIKTVLYRGDDCINNFLSSLLKTKDEIINILTKVTPLIISENEKAQYKNSLNCHICGDFFNESDEKLKKVCDHDHTTGLFVGAAHKHCNFLRSITRTKTPIFFHNSQGYDSHFIIDEIPRSAKIDKLEIIPKTEDKYISYSFDGLQFKDSFSFMASSLDNLVKKFKK